MIRYRNLSVLAALGAAMLATPAQAQSVNDIRCVLASNAASKISKVPNEQRLAESTMQFYLGRIDGKYDKARLTAAFSEQMKSLTGTKLGPTMQACLNYAQQRMRFVQSVGARMTPPKN